MKVDIEDKRNILFVPGLTPRSLFAIILCMLLAGVYTQFAEVIMDNRYAPAEQVLPITGMSVLILILFFTGIIYALTKFRLLNRAEMFCILFSLLISVPMMTQGMWHRFVGLISHIPRAERFAYIDAFNDKLWPHGKNVLFDRLKKGEGIEKGNISWEVLEYKKGLSESLPVFTHTSSEQQSSIRITVPLRKNEKSVLNPVAPHLISILVKSSGTDSTSSITCRIYEDDKKRYKEIFSVRESNEATFLHQNGYVRLGAYGVRFSNECEKELHLELRLKGIGTVTFADIKFLDVSALEDIYKGKRIISESDWNTIPERERPAGVIVKPDNLFSFKGIKYLLSGYIPLQAWIIPAISWGSFIFLLLLCIFSVLIIMRKQWAESERFSFPNAQIPMTLIGAYDNKEGAFSSVFRNRYLWAGFLLAIFYVGVQGWHNYNSNIPDLRINIPLKQYMNSTAWGDMWNTNFSISIFIISIAIFFELNVLISVVIGFWLFRSQFWVGELTNWKTETGYPFRYEQAIGAYLGYFAIVLFFTRKYILSVFKKAISGEEDSEEDILSFRTAFILIFTSFIGAGVWAHWMGTSMSAILIFFAFLICIGFVSSKLRAECGLVFGYFTPYNSMIFISLLGGMTMFGVSGMLLIQLLAGFLTVSVFFLIPGAQLECIHFGRKLKIRPSHIVITIFLGVFGGLFIGGWVFLSNAYALGGDSINFQWAFQQFWFFNSFESSLSEATRMLNSSSSTIDATKWGDVTIGISAVVTAIIAILRQILSGFWFHPIGFIIGSSHMAEAFWGSLLVAWVIRSIVLKISGANAVQKKLKPFFIGVFLGSIFVIVIFDGIGACLYKNNLAHFFQSIP